MHPSCFKKKVVIEPYRGRMVIYCREHNYLVKNSANDCKDYKKKWWRRS